MASRTDDDLDGFVEASQGGRPGLPVDPGRLLYSVKRDWRWIPLAAITWGVLGVLVAFIFIRHSYKAEAILVWNASGPTSTDRQLATEAGSLKLPGSLRIVRERMKLGIPVKVLDKQIEVFFDTRTNLVTVTAGAGTAREAMQLTNTVVEVFIEQQKVHARARAEDIGKALDNDVADARKRLGKARELFDVFRKENGVADIEQESQLAIANQAKAADQLQQARADLAMLVARVSGLENESKRQPKTAVLSSSTSNPNGQKLSELKAELATASARYSPEHPRIASLQAQIASLEAHAGKTPGVSTGVTTSVNPEYQSLQTQLGNSRAEQEVAEKRVKSYEEIAKDSEASVANLTALQGKARSFTADIDLLVKRIEELETQLSQARDAARSPPVEWRVLTPAVEPEWPEQSKRKAIVAGMPLAGALMALLVLLLRPLSDGRVYTAREAAFWANLPVLASSAWPRNREMFFTLVDELGDHGAATRGYTLVLGASGREKPLAEELAYWLGGNPVAGRRAPGGGGGAATRVEIAPNVRPFDDARGEAGSARSPVSGPAPQLGNVTGSEALVHVPRQVGALATFAPEGTHAWLGATEGPALRRAARMADRVIVLLTSGGEVVTSVASMRTRLGRDHGIGVVLLGLSTELLGLPDRAGDVPGFWRSNAGRRA